MKVTLKDYRNDVTLNNLVMSVDPECSPELTAMLGSAIAVAISDIPFDGPCATTQIGLIDGEFIINPNKEIILNSIKSAEIIHLKKNDLKSHRNSEDLCKLVIAMLEYSK